MRIAFRADASIQIGTGHVMRCLTLAEALRNQGHQCVFICRDHPGHLRELIAQKGFEMHLLSKPRQFELNTNDGAALAHADWLGATWQHDAEHTLKVLSGANTDWLVVDHYALDVRWESRIAKHVNKVMVIDDIADRQHECDLLLDQNLGRKPEDYDTLIPEACKCLIGPRYALLRPEFRKLRAHSLERRQTPKLERILITLGGVDRDNVTGQVLQALEQTQLPPETELDIVMGASAPGLEAVRLQAETLPFKATVSVNVSDMAERMCLADLCIGAAGSTSWERCCLGLPSIMIVLAENQRGIGQALEQSGAAYLVEREDILESLGSFLNELISTGSALVNLSNQAKMICDGQGSSRLVAEFCRDTST
ncbi:UDP-2,4-diacetamido-2,4,6-trideoxy-beta-L-altropyranose hydrolase [Marinobacter sp. DY40_1A1]|uniref:UDP-2,4-diacetamido-2,4, 6-trideoxy-beta-L-altropyranose hydrolase n=1 Tax=Marinobacter sp. DY40_1A1 TaxID=2583229 RepID=UPI0019041AC5|nr:UDP-2,4-diacetamido-2,4,6-trideoxy-beta-L-altropyranose hydrolase [Marinobacter sp. DY40_1A1]MBK1885429.1 UDP-2,4-diacetamido-2,4,6-trideoxy-beta-L-altropyranose hydrolase [Marinobacter sp. DY40_1A1]